MNLDPDPGYLDIKCVRLKEIEFSCAIQEIAFSCARLKETAPGCASLVEITTSYTTVLYSDQGRNDMWLFMQACGSGMIYSGSGSNFEISKFQIHAYPDTIHII